MAASPSIDIRTELLKLFPAAQIRHEAKACGAMRRLRKIDPVALFWTLVLGFCVSGERSFASLRRRYQTSTRQEVEESSFQARFNPGLAKLFKRFTAMRYAPPWAQVSVCAARSPVSTMC